MPETDPVLLERRDDVGWLVLRRAVTNALDESLIEALSVLLDTARKEEGLAGLVLTGSNDKFFSIGLDLPQLLSLGREDMRRYYRRFRETCLTLYTFPKPIVAALNGHAVAGGCILALCCDYRFMAAGRRRMGLNEIHLGVPVPYVADCVLRHLVGARQAREIVDGGEFYEPDDLLRLGLVDRVVPAANLPEIAGAKAQSLGRAPGGVFSKIKRDRTEAVEAEIRARMADKEDDFLDSWFSPAARSRLAEAAERF